YRQRLEDAERRLTSYRSREGGEFGFSGELAEKRRQLAEVEKSLALDVEGQAQRDATPVPHECFRETGSIALSRCSSILPTRTRSGPALASSGACCGD
ncbi:hypothetical protein EOC06_38700, partial [Mesorhizobium sp. M7A.F.Ca.MR.362.00.0.0]